MQNVTKMASGSGGKVTSEKLGDAEFKVTIEMEGAPAADEAEAICVPDAETIQLLLYHLTVWDLEMMN